MQADIYWNKHLKLFSVRHKGKVVAHTHRAMVMSPKFVVSEAGRQRVLREKRKNVHAFTRGNIILPQDEGFKEALYNFNVEDRISSDFTFAVYDPYDECGLFRALTVIGDIVIKGEFASYIKSVNAYTFNDKPQLKIKLS